MLPALILAGSLLRLTLLVDACVTAPATPEANTTFTDNTVFIPDADYTSWKTIYGRSLQLPDDSLLMTWEDYPPEPPLVYFPIYRSIDGGATWSEYSRVQDTQNDWGLRFQPFLYELQNSWGSYAAGTILAAGVSTPANLSGAYIELYASTDSARTWTFVSHIAYGEGPELVTNGDKAIWEPFLLEYGDAFVCFFSDQRDSAHAQKLVAVTTSDLVNWSDDFDVVAYSEYDDRPGMAVVAHIQSTDNYILTYECCGSENCQAYYKVSSSPLTFNSTTGVPILSNDTSKTAPVGSPYVIWTSRPDRVDGSGMIIMNAASNSEVFINEDSAGQDGWKMVDINQWSAYSRSLRIIDDAGESRLFLGAGGNMVSDSSCNWVSCGVVGLSDLV
ncbi:hypothetical protein N7456_013631 [Penicillium angulare]|uniref:Glycoside hydrolase family 93 protein n=1 Tax=Penicillium angulare TaxID=116970 RepID=A0A9W9EFS3_9EURO|nr:hypothetical protein N7456_013631 [Penicillium angulare]